MKIPFFNQTLSQLFTSKTNLLAIITFAMTVYGYRVGFIDYGGLMAGISGSLGMITLRDTLSK